MRITKTNDKLIILLNKEIYSEQIVFKCFYWYTQKLEVDIMSTGPHWEITIVTNGVNDVHKLISDIKKNLIDYKLRQIVADETRQVRELIIAKAFSYEDETPPPTTEISDPVGFDASSI